MDILLTIHVIIVILLGLILGSFASALIWRVPRNIPWIAEKSAGGGYVFCRSSCPHCGHVLSAKDLIPMVSWLFLLGRCRYCGTTLAKEYPLAEIMTVLLCLGIFAVWGFTGQAFFLFAAVPFLVALLFIDLRHMILPDSLNIILAGIAALFLLYQFLMFGSLYGYDRILLDKIGGLFLYPAIAYIAERATSAALKKSSMGLGDVKFFAASGLWLGVAYLPYFLLASGAIGVLCGIGYRIKGGDTVFPFGPALILALYSGLLLQGLEINPFM